MAQEWLNPPLDNESDDPMEEFYCPYTSGPDCALLTKGWQPQELCDAIDCGQLKLLRRGKPHRSEAA